MDKYNVCEICIHTMNYYLVIKRNVILPYAYNVDEL